MYVHIIYTDTLRIKPWVSEPVRSPLQLALRVNTARPSGRGGNKSEAVDTSAAGDAQGSGSSRGVSADFHPIPRSSMVLVYLPTKLGHLQGFYVGKYTSTMDDLG